MTWQRERFQGAQPSSTNNATAGLRARSAVPQRVALRVRE